MKTTITIVTLALIQEVIKAVRNHCEGSVFFVAINPPEAYFSWCGGRGSLLLNFFFRLKKLAYEKFKELTITTSTPNLLLMPCIFKSVT